MSSVIFGPSVQVESSNPTLPKTADDHPAEPLARYGAMWKARFTSGSAAVELHHPLGRDPDQVSISATRPLPILGTKYQDDWTSHAMIRDDKGPVSRRPEPGQGCQQPGQIFWTFAGANCCCAHGARSCS